MFIRRVKQHGALVILRPSAEGWRIRNPRPDPGQ